jgi:hypothetical protein
MQRLLCAAVHCRSYDWCRPLTQSMRWDVPCLHKRIRHPKASSLIPCDPIANACAIGQARLTQSRLHERR